MDSKRSIAENYSVDYYRHSLPTRSWKSPWNYAALGLALLVTGGMYLIARNTAFQAAPVATVHSTFGTNCASCHVQAWGAGRRLITLSDTHPSIPDATCQECHPTSKHSHIPLQEPACAACHQEHRPEVRLVDVADSACTSCHHDLKSATRNAISFASEVRQFETGAGEHPEFAVLRPSDEPGRPRHEAHRLAAFESTGEGAGKWMDRGGLKEFDHHHHLNPAGLLAKGREPEKLTCANCHVSGADGYMKPIVYETHCSRCHPLHLMSPFREITQLPHSSVEEVRGVIRERLARQIEQENQPPTATGPANRLPRLPVPARLTIDQEQLLAEKMKQADHAVFGLEAKGMCRHCHHVVQRGDDWQVLHTNPKFAEPKTEAARPEAASIPPLKRGQAQFAPKTPQNEPVPEPPEMVPSRWMPHARFNHVSHRAVECKVCHNTKNKKETTDILMPSIAVCRKCHGDDSPSASTRVSANCVLCHTYHDGTHAAAFQGVPLDKLFPK